MLFADCGPRRKTQCIQNVINDIKFLRCPGFQFEQFVVLNFSRQSLLTFNAINGVRSSLGSNPRPCEQHKHGVSRLSMLLSGAEHNTPSP